MNESDGTDEHEKGRHGDGPDAKADMRSEPSDGSTGDRVDPEVLEAQTGRYGERGDEGDNTSMRTGTFRPSDTSRDNYKIDDDSARVAGEYGRKLGDSAVLRDWSKSDYEQHYLATFVVGSELREALNLPEVGVGIDPSMPNNVAGYASQDQVRLNRDVLLDSQPDALVATMAHEYRHLWQERVMADAPEIAVRDEFRELLQTEARRDFDRQWISDEWDDKCEQDARAFENLVWEAYNSRRKELHT